MKKFIVSIALLFCMTAIAVVPNNVPRLIFSVNIDDPTNHGNPIPRTPVTLPIVGMDGNTLYFETYHPAFTLVLLDEEGEEAYVVNIPSSVESIVLPSTLSGIYELQIYDGSGYYYYCEIEL